MDQEKDPKKIAQVILDAVHLDVENYRLGNTKACNPMFIFVFKFILMVFLHPPTPPFLINKITVITKSENFYQTSFLSLDFNIKSLALSNSLL